MTKWVVDGVGVVSCLAGRWRDVAEIVAARKSAGLDRGSPGSTLRRGPVLAGSACWFIWFVSFVWL